VHHQDADGSGDARQLLAAMVMPLTLKMSSMETDRPVGLPGSSTASV